MTTRTTVWIHRARACTWLAIGALTLLFGWTNNVTLVWLASVYANTVSDWGAGEAADNRQLQQQLTELRQLIVRHQCRCRPTRIGKTRKHQNRKGMKPMG